jgi:hypothetical protein
MKEQLEGVVRTHLVTEVPEIDLVPMFSQVRRFDEDAYFFPIKTKPYVHDAIASACDVDITQHLVLGKHMDLYSLQFQEEKTLSLASHTIATMLYYKENSETLEQIEQKNRDFLSNLVIELPESKADTLEFAFKLGEAVAYGHFTGRKYDTETTYLPCMSDLDQLSDSDRQITQISGYHATWEAVRSMNRLSLSYPSPYYPLLRMCAWGACNFQFIGNDFYYDINYVNKEAELYSKRQMI